MKKSNWDHDILSWTFNFTLLKLRKLTGNCFKYSPELLAHVKTIQQK